jgi:hypothetical protein
MCPIVVRRKEKGWGLECAHVAKEVTAKNVKGNIN